MIKHWLTLFILLFSRLGFATQCDLGAEFTTKKKFLSLGEPFEAKLILWNNNCINLKLIKENSFVANGLYIHKIISNEISTNNPDVSVFNVIAIFTENVKNKQLSLKIGSLVFESKPFEIELLSLKKNKDFFLFDLSPTKTNRLLPYFIIISIVVCLLLVYFYYRKRKRSLRKKMSHLDYLKMIKQAETSVEYLALYEYRKEIDEQFANCLDFFELLNKVQYKRNISSSELQNLKQFKEMIVKKESK